MNSMLVPTLTFELKLQKFESRASKVGELAQLFSYCCKEVYLMASFEQATRSSVKYSAKFDRFVLSTKNYGLQYNGIYLSRLAQMKTSLRDVATKKWGKDCGLLPKIIDIESEHQQHHKENKVYVLIGTLYKDMSLRGSVLDEFKENNGISGAVQSLYHIASENDSLVLEDESGRIALGGAKLAPHVGHLVTGVVVAVRGTVDDNGVLDVIDWAFLHTLHDHLPTSPVTAGPVPTASSKYLLLVSGLQVGNPCASNSAVGGDAASNSNSASSELSAQLLMDFVAGRLGGQQADIDIASKIARVIVAGDSVAPVEETGAKDKHYKNQKISVSPSKQLDILLAQLLSVCPVDLLPGETDPANLTLPQQPLHPCLFPQSSRFSTFSRVTNPFEGVYDGVAVLGHAGQPVSDIARQRREQAPKKDDADSMDVDGAAVASATSTTPSKAEHSGAASVTILQDTLAWGHVCPTSPDTLPCYPFQDVDPFIIPEGRLPGLFFSGNQDEFATKLVSVDDHSNGSSSGPLVRLVSVPSFASTGVVVLVDISTPELLTTTLHFR